MSSSLNSNKRKPQAVIKKPVQSVAYESEKMISAFNMSKAITIKTKEELWEDVPKRDQHTHTSIILSDVLDDIKIGGVGEVALRCLKLGRKGCSLLIITSRGIPPVDDIVSEFDKYYKFKAHKVVAVDSGKRADLIVLEQK